MKKLLLGLFLIFALGSCFRFLGLTDDYDRLSGEEKTKVVSYAKAEILEKGKIYSINGTELRQEMAKHPKSLVYIFANGCSSESCFPMYVYEEYAKDNNYKLFLVMSGYGGLRYTVNQDVESPLFAIDSKHYGEEKSSKYFPMFKNDLRGLPLETSWKEYETDGSLYFFSGNQLDSVARTLSKVKPLTQPIH